MHRMHIWTRSSRPWTDTCGHAQHGQSHTGIGNRLTCILTHPHPHTHAHTHTRTGVSIPVRFFDQG